MTNVICEHRVHRDKDEHIQCLEAQVDYFMEAFRELNSLDKDCDDYATYSERVTEIVRRVVKSLESE